MAERPCRFSDAVLIIAAVVDAALAWGYNAKVSLVQLPTNYMYFKWVSVKPK